MVCKPGRNNRRKHAGLVVGFLLATAPLNGQVSVELSSPSLVVGERMRYSLTIDHEEPEDVVLPDLELPGLRLVDGPSIRPASRLSADQRRRVVEVRYEFEAVRPGRFVLEPAEISVAGQSFVPPRKLVEIAIRGEPDRVPFLARWVLPEGPLLVGQASAIFLEIYNIDEFVYPSIVSVPAPANAIFEEVQGLGRNRTSEVDGTTLYEIPVAVFMLTPSSAGSITIQPATVEWGGLVVTADQTTINVADPPVDIAQSGAIGTFTLSARISGDRVASTETLDFSLRIDGEGNLHYLQLPDVTLDGFVAEHEERIDRLNPAPGGYAGYVEQLWTLRPSGSGEGRITIDQFAYFDTGTRRVRRNQLPAFDVEITERREPAPSGRSETTFSLLAPDEIANLEPDNWFRNPLAYGFFAPGILVFIVSRFWRKRPGAAGLVSIVFLLAASPFPSADIDRGQAAYEAGDLATAIQAYESALRLSPESPGINHNLAILYFQAGDTGRSVFAAREAVRLNPGASRIRLMQTLIEQTAGLDRSVPVRHRFHPDVAFFALAAAVNLFGIVMAFSVSPGRNVRRGLISILRILVGTSVIAGCVLLAVAARTHDTQVGVVKEDVSLRRIPSVTAEIWLNLEAGTAVDVVTNQDGFVLIRTNLDLEGWVSIDELLYRDNPALSALRYRATGL